MAWHTPAHSHLLIFLAHWDFLRHNSATNYHAGLGHSQGFTLINTSRLGYTSTSAFLIFSMNYSYSLYIVSSLPMDKPEQPDRFRQPCFYIGISVFMWATQFLSFVMCILSGFPYGNIIGSLLFTICINHLATWMCSFFYTIILLLADDTKHYKSISTSEDIVKL